MSGETPTPAPTTIAESIHTLEDAVVSTGDTVKNVMTHPNIYETLIAGFTFKDVLAFIDTHYDFTYVPFSVGNLENTDPAKTTGSCKVLAYARLMTSQHMSQKGILDMFAEHYADVLSKPNDTNHPNIRALMNCGIEGVVFHGEIPLKLKK